MRRIPSWGIVVGIIVIAAVFGCGIGWWVSRNDAVAQSGSTGEAPQQPAQTTHIPAATKVGGEQAATSESTPTAATNASAAAPVLTAGEEQWQQELDQVLLSDSESTDKADRLIRMLPHLKEEAQVEVSQHLVNFLTDDQFPRVAPMLTNAATPESVSTVLMTDLLNRNDALKLPLILEIARNENHPKHTEAVNLLELYLQENYGNDWAKWQQGVTNWLAENGPQIAVEPAAAEPLTESRP